MINYRNVNDLNAAILRGLHLVPHDIDIVVGVPRSGLLAANLLALYLHCPLAELSGFLDGRLLRSGRRGEDHRFDALHAKPLRVLVVDDSLDTGSQMNAVRTELASAGLPHEYMFGAVFVNPRTRNSVDFYFDEVAQPRVFQWNLMHSHLLAESCVDIDGVLCRDPSREENDDGPRYEAFILSAPPAFLPSVPIGWLVTCRLEKYRELTKQWLKQHAVQYRELIMLDMPSAAARLASGIHGRYKAEVYNDIDASLFIESSESQARTIAKLTAKQILCTQTWEMMELSKRARMHNAYLWARWSVANLPQRAKRSALRRLGWSGSRGHEQ